MLSISSATEELDGGRGPFARQHLLSRTWPFLVVSAAGIVLALTNVHDSLALLLGAGLLVLIAVAVLVLPWERLPRWADVLPPLAALPAFGLLIHGAGGGESGLAPLVLLSVAWAAFYGTQSALGLTIAGAALTFAVPLILIGDPEYPDGEWRAAVLWIVIGGLLGVTVQLLVQRVRRGGEVLVTAILDSALDPMIAIDHEGRVIEFNPAAERTFGYRREDALGQELAELVVPDSLREAHRRGLERYMAQRVPTILGKRLELTGMRSDGSEFPVELTVTRMEGIEPPAFTGNVRDLSAQKRAERETAAQHSVARVLAESPTAEDAIPALLAALGESMGWDLGGVWLADERAGVLRCHALWQRESVELTEFRERSTGLEIPRGVGPLGKAWSTGEPVAATDAAEVENFRRAEVAARQGLRNGLWMPIRSGPEVLGVIEFYSRRGDTLDDAMLRTVATIGAQVSEFLRRRHAEEALAHQALHDGLTGLPNRALLLDRLGHALDRARRDDSAVAVLAVDVDNFKVINDSLGHEAGNQLLVDMAGRIQTAVRKADTVARFGGDEFVVLCEQAGEEGAVQLAERIAAEARRPLVTDGQELMVTTSIGIAVAAQGRTPESVLRDADAAMYRAKERGRGRYELFDEEMRSRAFARLAGETDLRRAIEDGGELRLHYQPIVAVADGSVRAVEALVRWQHPERGLVPPGEFIPLAEQSGLIVPLGRWVLGEACAEAAAWPDLAVSVNVSTRQLLDRGLVADVAAVLARTGLAPERLSLEITETLIMERLEASTELLRELKTLGVRLCLDDFGTGYSSLSYLERLPLDVLKLDRSFVSGLVPTAPEPAIVAAVIEMGRALGMTVVAEGVETEEQRDRLEDLGCVYAQGFYFARPMAAAEISALPGTLGGRRPPGGGRRPAGAPTR